MKKIYINELETEKRNKLIKSNSKLIEILQNDLYDNNMGQLEDYYIEVREDGTSDNVIRLDVSYTETFI